MPHPSRPRHPARLAHLRRHLGPSHAPDPTPPRAPSCAPAGAAGQQDEAPLAGVKVVDLTTIFSGPICASILGDHGVYRPAPPSLAAPAHCHVPPDHPD